MDLADLQNNFEKILQTNWVVIEMKSKTTISTTTATSFVL